MISSMDIREWAEDNNINVGERGRLPKSVKVAFLQAHPKTARELAVVKGIDVGRRGRLAPSLFESLV